MEANTGSSPHARAASDGRLHLAPAEIPHRGQRRDVRRSRVAVSKRHAAPQEVDTGRHSTLALPGADVVDEALEPNRLGGKARVSPGPR